MGLPSSAWASPLILQHVMGNEATKFDGRKVGTVRNTGPYDTACHFNRESGIRTVDDWFASKRPVKIASIGPGTSLSDVPKLLKAALGLPLDMVEGYTGGAEARLAVESGEVDGLCASWQATKVTWRSQMESGKIRVVLQATLKSHPDLKNVPLAINSPKLMKRAPCCGWPTTFMSTSFLTRLLRALCLNACRFSSKDSSRRCAIPS